MIIIKEMLYRKMTKMTININLHGNLRRIKLVISIHFVCIMMLTFFSVSLMTISFVCLQRIVSFLSDQIDPAFYFLFIQIENVFFCVVGKYSL